MGTRGTGPGHRPATACLLAPSARERLVAAMAATCAEHGYRAASVEDVLARTGLPRQAFDEHFADKAECAIAALDELLSETTQAVSRAQAPEFADWRRLLLATRALLELLAAQPSAARLALIEARTAMPAEAYDRYAAGIRVLVALLDRVRTYADGGAPASATRGAIGGAELLIRRELLAGREDRLPELLPDIIYGTVVPFLPQQEALRYAALARELLSDGG
ncbi:MAG TPA: TetR/AcrR family transcriptional regulator [Solirubrobacterales bacterium]|nr:TetR/AcrR family transcriptional regulator [Solirubrobacterales bacterium]